MNEQELTARVAALEARVQAQERQLHAAHERLRFHADSSPLAVIEWSVEMRVTAWNAAAEQMFGWRSEEVLGRSFEELQLVYIEDRARVAARVAELVSGASTSNPSRNRNVRKDGGVIDCEWYNSSLYDPSGRLTSVLSLVLDVTGHRRAQEEARASEQRALARAAELQTVLDTVPAVVWIAHDRNADHIEANRHGAALLAMPRGVNVSITAPEGERPTNFRVFKDGRELLPDELPIQAAARFGTEFRDYELDVVFADGAVRHLLGNSAPLRDAAGATRGSVGAFIDITERKRAEARAEALARFPEENPDPVLRLASDFRVLYANQAASASLGGFGVVPGGVVAPRLAELAARALAGQRFKSEIESDGTVFSLSLVPVGDEVNVYGQDITARKRAEEALQEADRRKSEFLAMLSHELRNPLSAIRNSAYLLDRAAAGSEVGRRARAVIDRQVGHLARLVDDLLAATRITSDKVHLQRRALDLRDQIRDAVDDLRPAFETRGVKLSAELPTAPVLLEADPERLAQVVGNLLQHAASNARPGGHARVSLTLDPARHHAVITIADDGIDLAANTRERLSHDLALVRTLVEIHGGELSAPGDGLEPGARLRVRLPLAAIGPVTVGATPRLAAGLPRWVLIIEDNVDAAELLRDLLQLGDHTVALAFSGPDGLDCARSFRPDVVLCDIGLPTMDGYAVAAAIRADPELADTCLIALSGYAQPEDIRRATTTGFDHHVAKPPDLDRLEAILSSPDCGRP